jgi:DNA-binding transcriptional regulator YiaG
VTVLKSLKKLPQIRRNYISANKRIDTMQGIKRIREVMQLSQEQLAPYLGVTRSQLAMVETHRRDLPTAALLKLAQLETSLKNNMHHKPETPQLHTTKDLTQIKQFAKKCCREAELIQAKLERMQTSYQHAQQTLLAVGQLQAQTATGKTNRKDQLWIELLHTKTMKKLSRCCMAEQVKKRLMVQALQQAAAQAENLKF